MSSTYNDIYIVTRRFIHKGVTQKPGDQIRLTPADAGRLGFMGAVYGPIQIPKRKRRRGKNAKPAK